MDARRFQQMRLDGAAGASAAEDNLKLDELEVEENAPRGPTASSVVGAPHPSIVPDSHFGNLSTAETFENYYGRQTQYDSKLPITAYREEIVSTIESNSVTVIQGATGSGKTTQVPQYLLDRAYEKQEHCNIIVTQPRRIAAVSIARRICSERGWEVGGLVGFQIAMNRSLSEDTRLTFCTTGILLEKLIQNKNMTQYTHIILDEVHERDNDVDMSLLVVRKMLRTNSKHVKVILMSATIASEDFSDYFASEIQGILQNAPVLSVEGRMYPVQEHYLDDYKWLVKSAFMPDFEDRPSMSSYAAEMCCELVRLFDTMEDQSGGGGAGTSRGTVLVFLPGMGEIQDVNEMLAPMVEKEMLQLISLHSKVHFDDQQKAFVKAEQGRRKVILATNIAESSITVPDVCYVIDFCLVKHLILDDTTNYSSLRLCWASRASLLQRQGRAGRVQSGHCFRLIPKKFYRDFIQDYSVPEMQRQSLEQVVLRVKTLDMGDPQSLLEQALSPPNRERIAHTVLVLKEVGALSLITPGLPNIYDGELTFAGKVMASLPVDVRVARLLLLGHVFGYLNECLVIGAVLSLRSFFSSGFRDKKLKCFRDKLMWSNGSQSDSFASLYAYLEWKLKLETRGFRDGRKGQSQWGYHHGVHVPRMNEVDQLVHELRGRLLEFGMVADGSLPEKARHGLTAADQLILKVILAGAFYPFYFDLTREPDDMALKGLSGHDQLTTVQVMGMPPTAPAYEREIRNLFRDCGKVKKVHFEASTKAFVEFERVGTQENNMLSGVLPAVLLAIKMRMIRMPMVLEMNKKQDGQYLEEKTRENLRTFGLPCEKKPAGEQHRSLPQYDFSCTQQMEIQISEVVNANHFWAQLSASSADLDSVTEWIERRRQGFKALRNPAEGMVCMSLWTNDMKLYRARIESIHRHDRVAEVVFLDFGNRDRCPLGELKECPDYLFTVQQQAFECMITGIRPSVLESGGSAQWSQRAVQLFSDMTSGKRLWAQVYSMVESVIRCDLIDTTDPTSDINISSALINHSVAEPCPESLISKRAHDALVERLQGGPGACEGDSLLAGALAGSGQRSMADTLQEDGWTTTDTPGVGPRTAATYYPDDDVEEHPLKGPYSTYELKISSMTSLHLAGRVERDSVNSVMVDDSQTTGFQRMAIGANVGLAQSGFSVNVRECSVMPSIKGMPALMVMLFCPMLEMRASARNHYYTGCLAGSGPNPTTKEPVFPEHDIELVFDVTLDQADLADINAIRRGINLALVTKEEQHQVKWTGGQMSQVQKVQREKVLKLLQRDRAVITATEHFAQAYTWNKVHADNILPASELDPNLKESGPAPFLHVHSAVRLHGKDKNGLGGFSSSDGRKPVQLQVQQLYKIASRSEVALDTPAHCPMCQFNAATPRQLLHHLNSRNHREEEKIVFN